MAGACPAHNPSAKELVLSMSFPLENYFPAQAAFGLFLVIKGVVGSFARWYSREGSLNLQSS